MQPYSKLNWSVQFQIQSFHSKTAKRVRENDTVFYLNIIKLTNLGLIFHYHTLSKIGWNLANEWIETFVRCQDRTRIIISYR